MRRAHMTYICIYDIYNIYMCVILYVRCVYIIYGRTIRNSQFTVVHNLQWPRGQTRALIAATIVKYLHEIRWQQTEAASIVGLHTNTRTPFAQLIATKTGACIANGRQLGTLAGTKRTIQQANFVKTPNFTPHLIVQLFSKVRKVRKHN